MLFALVFCCNCLICSVSIGQILSGGSLSSLTGVTNGDLEVSDSNAGSAHQTEAQCMQRVTPGFHSVSHL